MCYSHQYHPAIRTEVKKIFNQFSKWFVQFAKWWVLVIGLVLYVDFIWMGKLALSSTKVAFSFVCKLLQSQIKFHGCSIVANYAGLHQSCFKVSCKCLQVVKINSALVSFTSTAFSLPPSCLDCSAGHFNY